MRSYVGAHGAPIAAVVLATGVALSGCADDEGAERTAPVSAAASSGAAEPSTTGEPEAEPEDTWGDVADPATVPLDADQLRGVGAVSIWEGAELLADEGRVGGEVILGPGRSLIVFVTSTGPPLGGNASEAVLREWRRFNVVSGSDQSQTEVLEPVVVDGVEMLRARATSPTMVGDVFVRGTDEYDLEVLISTPADFSEDEREQAIAQVMATVELE